MRLPHPIILVCLAVICGCTVDTIMKTVTLGGTAVLTATAWRFILAGLIMLVLFVVTRRPVPGWKAIRFHMLRGLAQVSSAVAFFYALTQISLVEAVIMGFTAALMIAPIARVLLGEHMSPVTAGGTTKGRVMRALSSP